MKNDTETTSKTNDLLKKSSIAVTLAILGPALLTGCRSSYDENGNQASQSSGAGYRGGGGHYVGGSGNRSSSPRGGFGGFGSFFSGGS